MALIEHDLGPSHDAPDICTCAEILSSHTASIVCSEGIEVDPNNLIEIHHRTEFGKDAQTYRLPIHAGKDPETQRAEVEAAYWGLGMKDVVAFLVASEAVLGD